MSFKKELLASATKLDVEELKCSEEELGKIKVEAGATDAPDLDAEPQEKQPTDQKSGSQE